MNQTNQMADVQPMTRTRTRTVLIRYFAGAQAAAGVAEDLVELGPADGPVRTVADVLAAELARRGAALARVLPSCSVLLNGVAVHDHATEVPDGAELDVLPPFAGG
ncbi:MAG TPA: MoaD/ThiS family protein [Pseudonocardiaceae bacterium]